MKSLNLPPVQFRIRQQGDKKQVFDVVRKKYVALTPEEWVRQHFIHFLMDQKHYPAGLVAVEMPVAVNGLKQRADVVVYNRKGRPVVVVECKAPSVSVSKAVFDQAARYNMQLQVDYLIVTNGLQHYCAHLNGTGNDYQMMADFPDFDQINTTK